MAEPLNVRLKDATDPDRSEKFEKATARFDVNPPDVIRSQVDTYLNFIIDNGHPPERTSVLVSGLDEHELELVRRAAKRDGMLLSDWMAAAIMRATEEPPSIVVREDGPRRRRPRP